MIECANHHDACECREELIQTLLSAVKLAEATLIKLSTASENEKAIKMGALRALGQAILDATKYFST